VPVGIQDLEILRTVTQHNGDTIGALQRKAGSQCGRRPSNAIGQRAVALHNGAAGGDTGTLRERATRAGHLGGDVQLINPGSSTAFI